MFLLQCNSSNLETSEALYCPHLRMMVGEIPDCLHNLLRKHHTVFHITNGLSSNILLYMLVFYSSVDSVRMEIIHFNSAIYFESQMWMLVFELFRHCMHATTVWDYITTHGNATARERARNVGRNITHSCTNPLVKLHLREKHLYIDDCSNTTNQ